VIAALPAAVAVALASVSVTVTSGPVTATPFAAIESLTLSAAQVRQELISIRGLLGP